MRGVEEFLFEARRQDQRPDERRVDAERMRVTLVLVPTFGEALASLDPPLWVCDSAANRRVVERLRSQPGCDPMGITVITTLRPSSEATCIEAIDTIEVHHPRWTELVVIGAVTTPAVRAAFAPFEPGELLESPAGFTFVRAPSVAVERWRP